jgi:hypothetical protein
MVDDYSGFSQILLFSNTVPLTNYNYPLRYQGYLPECNDPIPCNASCKFIAYQRQAELKIDIYKKRAAKAPTPATKPAALSEEAAPVN